MATEDFDMSATIEADRLSRKEWEAAVSQAWGTNAPENPEAGSFTEVAPGVIERNLKMIYIPPYRIKVAATSPEATEDQRAAFEADFNKFLAQQRVLQESAMARALAGENVYLKIGADGTLNEIAAAEAEAGHQNTAAHFPGCLCELCIGIRGAHPIVAADTEGSDVDHPIATERKTVAGHVADILGDLQFGKCTRGEAVEVERAAKRAIADHDLSRSIGKM